MSATALIAKEKAVMDRAKAEVEVAEDTYPMDTCVVSGGKLGSMGDAVVYDYEGREVRFCCAGCVKKFEGDPEKYIQKLGEARKIRVAQAVEMKATKEAATEHKGHNCGGH